MAKTYKLVNSKGVLLTIEMKVYGEKTYDDRVHKSMTPLLEIFDSRGKFTRGKYVASYYRDTFEEAKGGILLNLNSKELMLTSEEVKDVLKNLC